MRKIFICLAAAGLCAGASARELRVQGRLTDVSGAALAGSRTVTFRLYEAATGGAAVWSSGAMGVSAGADGAFSAVLSGLDTLTFDRPYHLGLSVDGSAELSPRQALGAAAYAQAGQGDFAVNGNVSLGAFSGTPSVRYLGLPDGAGSFADNAGGASIYFENQGASHQGIGFKTHRSGVSHGTRMFIDSTGNVGIGTKGPGARLHVSGGPYPQVALDDAASRTFALGVTVSTFRIRDVTAAADRLTIDSAGNVGIGRSPEYKLDVAGTVRGNLLDLSDGNLKKDVSSLPPGVLGQVLRLNGVSFKWDRPKARAVLAPRAAQKGKPAAAEKELDVPGLPEGPQIGLIAQEVEAIFPQLVQTDKDGVKAISYMGVTTVLLEAVKAQQKQIAELRKELDALKSRMR